MKYTVVNYSNQICPNDFKGSISISQSGYGKLNTTANQKFSNNLLILVLESPHSSEYQPNGTPIHAANGTSGNNICKYLGAILNRSFSNNSNLMVDYDVFVINAIKKQCSLGIKPINPIIRESNFLDEWINGGEKDFISDVNGLLNQYSKNPNSEKVIVNLCTNGDFIDLKELVSNCLKNSGKFNTKFNLFKGPHPSSAQFTSCTFV